MIGQLYKYGMLHNIVSKNLAEHIEIEKKRVAKDQAFTSLEIKRMWDNLDSVEYADYLLCMCYTGFRIGEFLSLTPFQYDRENHTLKGGNKTEAGKNRIVPVHPKIIPLVEKALARGGVTIFCRKDGRAFTPDNFRKDVWPNLLKSLNLNESFTPHATRHTCATMLSAAGSRPEDIAKIMGHVDYEITTDVYINQEISTLRKAIELVS